MDTTTGAPLLPGTLSPDVLGALPAPVAIAFALFLTLALAVAGRKAWPLSARRALFFSLLFALVQSAAALLPEATLAAAGPGLLVASRILALVAVVECVQGVLFDLLFTGWLKRPPVPRILRDFLTLALALAAFLALLRGTLGVNLSSLLATSAMISVVLGLALQDTLGGFFAGLALQMENPLTIGEWVQIGEHLGQVTQVSWRTVRLCSMETDEITIPNSLVTRSTLVNFSRPTVAHQCFVEVRLGYEHPPNEVIAALAEAAGATPGVLAAPAAHALVWAYGESEIVYRARYWIGDFRRINYLRSDVGANIWYRLRRAGIANAYPSRVLRPAPAEPPADAAARHAGAALGAVDIFAPLSDSERGRLAERLRPLVFGRGETVIRQGEVGDSLFVITRGCVEVLVSSGGADAVVNTLRAGSFFGEMSLLTGEPRTATVVASEDTELFAVTREDFRRVAAGNPALLADVARVVSDRRCRLAEAIRETNEAAAARAAAHLDLVERVRSFFGV
jgi:small-conductance mechanosensitive channel/CRP-like cAMP-binding protein